MKSVLLPVDQNEQMSSAFETAWLATNLLDGVVEGVALTPAVTDIVAAGSVAAIPTAPHGNRRSRPGEAQAAR